MRFRRDHGGVFPDRAIGCVLRQIQIPEPAMKLFSHGVDIDQPFERLDGVRRLACFLLQVASFFSVSGSRPPAVEYCCQHLHRRGLIAFSQ